MKNLKNLGKSLNKKEQQSINGGSSGCINVCCSSNAYCGSNCETNIFAVNGICQPFRYCNLNGKY